MRSKDESLVLNSLIARRENYGVSHISHTTGRYYEIVMCGRRYNAVVLFSSFEFYTRRYHLADIQPNLCVCMVHDSVLPIDVLNMRRSNYAQAYELPEVIENIDQQRKGKVGSQVLLSQYVLGVHTSVDFVEDLPATTRKRYQNKARALDKREKGKPVGLDKNQIKRKRRGKTKGQNIL